MSPDLRPFGSDERVIHLEEEGLARSMHVSTSFAEVSPQEA